MPPSPYQQYAPNQGQHPTGQYPPGTYSPGQYPPAGRPAGPGPGFSAGPPVPPALARRKQGSIIPALIFGLLAVILGGVAAYLYIQERGPENPVAPTARPAENQYVQVQTALQDAGLTADVSADLRSASSYPLFPVREPGQAIQVEGHDAWIYIFTGSDSVADQEASTAAFRAEDAPPVSTASGTQLTTGPPMLFSHSNVIILLSTDDDPGDDIAARIQEAVESLP